MRYKAALSNYQLQEKKYENWNKFKFHDFRVDLMKKNYVYQINSGMIKTKV